MTLGDSYDFKALVNERLSRFRVIRQGGLHVESMEPRTMRLLEDGTSRCITEAVILTNSPPRPDGDATGMTVCRNNWGHKYGQLSFLVFARDPDGKWVADPIGNHEVSWRGVKREPKTHEAIDESILEALDDALKLAIVGLL